MMRKRMLAITLVCALLPFAGLAAEATAVYALCPVGGCERTELHAHQDAIYAGHFGGDGHASHKVCNVPGCSVMEAHAHNGIAYFGHDEGDGHTDHAACPVNGCKASGVHAHNGTLHFPHSKSDGHGNHDSGQSRPSSRDHESGGKGARHGSKDSHH